MKSIIIVLGLGLTLSFGPTQAEPVMVETFQGSVSVETSPHSTYVYDMAALDTLDALGVENITSIGKTYLPYLAQYQGDAGTLFEPDFEAVYAAKPDLVIVGGRSLEHLVAMHRIAPTIDMTIWGHDLVGQAFARLHSYGELYDRADRAVQLQRQVELAMVETAAAVAGKGTGLILMTNGPKVSAYGSGSRFGWIYSATGLSEAVVGLEDTVHGQAVSFEFIKEVNPDWLLVIDRVAAIGAEGTNARQTLDNPLVRQTRAWASGNVIYLDAARVYIAAGGVQSILGTLETIRTGFSAANTSHE